MTTFEENKEEQINKINLQSKESNNEIKESNLISSEKDEIKSNEFMINQTKPIINKSNEEDDLLNPRNELIKSAVEFLSDPSIKKSSLNKKVAFLESKGLKSSEIQEALSLVNLQKKNKVQNQKDFNSKDTHLFDNNNKKQIPPPLPSNLPNEPISTWKEYFGASIVTGAVAYCIYGLTKTFIAPLFNEPNEKELEEERKKLDAQYEEAFQLIEQIKLETETNQQLLLKQTSKMENSINELNQTIQKLKDQDEERSLQVNKVWDEIENVKKLIPEAFDKTRQSQYSMLTDLQLELKNLKNLVLKSNTSTSTNANTNLDLNSILLDSTNNNSNNEIIGTAINRSTSLDGINSDNLSKPVEMKKAIPAWQMSLFNKAKQTQDKINNDEISIENNSDIDSNINNNQTS